MVTEGYLDKRLAEFATEKSMKEAIKASEKRIINAVKTMMEIRDEELDGAHQDELDVVAGEKVAPTPWKSIPRRLQSVETEVDKIKDHLALS